MLIGLVVGWAASAQGQAFRVYGGGQRAALFRSAATSGGPFSAGEVLRAEVTHRSARHSFAVVGISKPRANWGNGAYFEGGYRGVFAAATVPGPGSRYGLHGDGSNGNLQNTGVLALAGAPSGVGSTAFGVFGQAVCISGPDCTKHAVYANGDLVWTGSHYHISDLRFKESLAPVAQVLPKLLALEVVSYEHIRAEEFAHMNLPEGPQVGFVAQQVAEVLPELVVEAVHPGAGDPLDRTLEAEPIRYQALKTIDLIPYLVRAVQEQQAEIEALKAQLLPLRNRLAELEPKAGAGEAEVPAAF